MDGPPLVLLLAGLDPSGGAGLAQDLRVLEALGARGLPVPTCLTAQSRLGFHACHGVEPELFAGMLASALEHAPPRAVKVGLLAGPEQAARLAALLPRLPCVVDPILRPTLAAAADRADALAHAYRRCLAPLGVFFTPNLLEAGPLAGLSPEADPAAAAAVLLDAGAGAVVVKGGHGRGSFLEDLLFTKAAPVRSYRRPRRAAGEVHGTGCAFSSACAALLARGFPLEAAVDGAGAHVAERVGRAWSAGPGPLQLG